jgi:outer membrane protein TolC
MAIHGLTTLWSFLHIIRPQRGQTMNSPASYAGYVVLCLFVSLATSTTFAQAPEKLTMEDAVNTALENNFDIKVVKTNTEISQINNHRGNAGYLPTVNANASYNYQNSNTLTEFAGEQPPIDVAGAVTQVYNAGVTAGWNVFSGNRRKYTLAKLGNAVESSRLAERQQIEQVVLNVMTQYLQSVNALNNVEVAKDLVAVSQERYNRVKENYGFGNFTRLQLLNAEVDLRNDSSSLFLAELAYEQSIQTLNNAMGIEPDKVHTVDRDISFDSNMELNALLEATTNQNAAYLLAKTGVKNAEYDQLINKANFLPTLDLSAGYNYSNSLFGASFLKSTRTFGLNAGVTVSYNIYNGGNVRRNEQTLRLQTENQKHQLNKAQNDIHTNLYNAFSDYQTNEKLLRVQERNLAPAQVNYDQTNESFGTGQATGLELRQAQLNLTNAKLAITTQRIQVKISEAQLLFLSGQLVK